MKEYITQLAFTSRDSEGNIGVGYHKEGIRFKAESEEEALEVLLDIVTQARKERPTDTIGIDGFCLMLPDDEFQELDHLITENLAYVCDWQEV